MIRKPRTGKRDNGDGTSTERWLCGCEYDTDNHSGRIVAERPCPRHAQPPVPGNATIPHVAAPPSQPRQHPAPGCALCGFYPYWDCVLGWYVERYEKCPAHQGVSR